jgi:hypothetical protein
LIQQVEDGIAVADAKLNLLQAILYVINAWSEVSPETITNCWKHTGLFGPTGEHPNLVDAETLLELQENINGLRLPNPMQAEDFVNYPKEAAANETLTEAQILDMYKPADIAEDDDEPLPPPTPKQAQKFIDGLRRFFFAV